MRGKSGGSLRWLNGGLVLAFALAGASVGTLGVMHDALHRASIHAWHRQHSTERLGSPDLERTVSVETHQR